MKKFVKEKLQDMKLKILGKSEYGKYWQKVDSDWYDKIYEPNQQLHETFKRFLLVNKSTIQTVIEVGCGSGIYPIKYKELFSGLNYTGIDISKPAIEHCKKNSTFEFLCGDILKMILNKRFDLVFSHSVIDHIYDIDGFIQKLIELSNQHIYIHSYRGFFPNIPEHKMNWKENTTCYINDLSLPKIKKSLLKCGIKTDEFSILDNKIIQITKHSESVEQ